MMKRTVTLIGMCVLLAGAAGAQESRPGPVTPPKREVKRIPVETTPEPPPIPVDEIIQRFTTKEEELKRVHESLNYRLTVRIQEFDEQGAAAGEWKVESDVVFKPDGSRVGRIASQTPSTLKRAKFYEDDLEEFASIPQFVLTTDQRERYDITYQGRQPVDELSTYVFRIQPRRLERRVRQFDGLVWVDDRDFAIVKIYGSMVTEVAEEAGAAPFQLFETYREFVNDKYWLPTYTRSEDTIKSQAGEARLRLTLRMTDYRPREK